MGKLPANYRLPEETVAWVKAYAKERGCSQAEVIEMAVASLRGDVRGGVPDLVEEVRSAPVRVPPGPRPAPQVTRDSLAMIRQRALNDAKYGRRS